MLIFFPDDNHIVATTNIHFRQACIEPSKPVLAPKYHWEGPRTNLYGSVFKSDNGYEMYYQCGNALRLGYAFSADGLHWERPMINATDFSAEADKVVVAKMTEGLEMTNLVAGCHMPSVIYDPDSEAPYKIFAFGDSGYRTMHSQTGKQFVEYVDNPAIPLMNYKNPNTEKIWCSDVAPCFKDKPGYTAMVKTYSIDNQGRTRRSIGKSTSVDFKHWSPVTTVWEAGAAEDAIAQARGYHWADFYGLCPFPYGSGYLGFLWLFEIDKELPKGTNLGKIEVFLAYSPDGENWRRLNTKALIPWDLNFGEDGGMVTTPSAPIFEDNEIKLYYSDSNYEHGMHERDYTKEVAAPTWVIRCARLPKERLVGAHSKAGSLTLAEILLQGQRIRLNVDCQSGSVRLDYRISGRLAASQLIENINETDYFLDLPVQGKVILSITLSYATVYALEVL